YTFDRDEHGFVTSLSISAPVNDRSQWPTVTPNPTPGVKAHVSCTAPHMPFACKHAVVLQGVLCLYGLERIDWRHPAIEWIAETPDEAAALQVNSFSI